MEDIHFHIQTNPFKNVTILIPAYNPDNKLQILVEELINSGAEHIVVVDDGSKNQCRDVFEIIKRYEQCTVLKHAVNLGKGRALKTAFNYFLNYYKDFIGVITVDADGQHKCSDIVKVAQMMEDNPGSIILGARNFGGENIPMRSRLGNLITSKVFRFFTGITVSDTQTGLRGISYNNLHQMMKIKGEKYEYEMNMLMDCTQKGIAIKEVAIETVYIEKNKSSHFNPLMDSLKIYSVFLKFMASSFSSFFVDILCFVILVKLFSIILPKYFIFIGTIGSRVLSSAFNYAVNREAVFSSKSHIKNTALKYYILASIQMILSGLGVSVLYNKFHQGELVIKMVVDSLLFLTSFRVQRDWVFNTGSKDMLGGKTSIKKAICRGSFKNGIIKS